MKNKVLKAIMVIFLIITLTMADFILLGTKLVTYASQNIDNTTNNDNVKFAAYFKTEEKEVSQIEYHIDNAEMKLYLKVAVEKEGYFDGVITLENSNFKIKQNSKSEVIKKIEGNTITLNQINAGSTAIIELGIEPIIEESYKATMLNQKSLIKLTGEYKDSEEKLISIKAEKKVALNLLTPANIDTTLTGKVITNRIYKIGEENKRIVQLELNSNVLENSYPIEQTTFKLAVPKGIEKVEVITKGTYATSGEADRNLENNYEYNAENSTISITIKNQNKDGKIAWNKNATDNIILTLILGENAEIGAEQYEVKSSVKLYGTEEKTIEKTLQYNLSEEKDGLIRASIQNAEEIYKGKIYSGEERTYNSTTNIEINYANLIETSTISETTTYRVDKESEDKASNTQYVSTTIKKSEISTILGESGVLTIKGSTGETLSTINKDTEADENGNVIVIYPEGIKVLEIELTKAVQTGIIRLNHTKVIKAESYSREEIKAFNYLVEKVKVSYNTEEYEFEMRKTLGETQTVAELMLEPKTLSTATVNEAVKIAVTLRTDNEKYDLYKNPTITIKLPDYITNINVTKTTALYLENMQISKFEYVPTTKEIKLQIKGEQTKYNSINTNIYLEILANIELEETTPNKEDKITLTYTNQKAVTYLNEGKCIVPVNISGYSGLVGFNTITNYGIQSVSAGESAEQIGNLKMYQNATEANFQITLVNNTGTNLENIKILGNLPVDGETSIGNYRFTNTVGATLKTGINLEEGTATIYYTENKNATKDLQNIENGWNSNLSALTNPVLYMLVINQMSVGMQVKANYTMNIPANVDYNKDMRTTYVAEYSSNISSVVISAKPVGLETGKVMVTLDANVGNDKLENGATVKAGEVIKYKITVENTGSNVANNVKITGIVPEGTVYVEPIEEYYQNTEIYYNEIQKDSIERNIVTLSSKEKQTFEYEVRVKNDIEVDSIKNQVTAVYGDGIEVKSNEMSNKLASANIRVTVKRMANVENLLPGNIGKYYVVVENISNVEQKNLKVKFNMPSSEIATLQHIEELNTEVLETSYEWNIDSIQAGKCKVYSLFVKVNRFAAQSVDVDLSAVVTQENNTYRSNVYNETLYGIDIEIKMTSPNEGEYLKTDDVIEYNIEIKNKSIQTIPVTLVDNIPQQLSISKIEINGAKVEENALDNFVYKSLEIKANETMNIKISTIVNYDRFRLENVTITNKAKILYIDEEIANTDEISHIIESIVIKEEPENPSVDPEEPPVGPETPENPEKPETPPVEPEKNKYNISGKAYVDQDKDGELNNKDNFLKDINVRLLNVETNEFVRDAKNNKDLIVKTNEEGYYEFEQIPEGKYIVVFEYDKDLYKPTIYEKEGIEEAKNSNVVSKTIEINGTQKEYATTNTIELKQNTSNINMGLVFIKQFDIKLDKYISKIQVQTSKGITTYDYQNAKLAKVEVNAKRIVGSTILVQYTIKATNIGDVDAYITSIADYIPAGLKFSSELNTDWYNLNENLYTNALQNTAIAPGESKEIKLTLIKNKTDGDAELINNMAEIQEAYNIYGISDTNSTEANMNKDENDLGSADLIIGIQTGTTFNYIALVISMLGVIGVAAYLINRKIMRIKF